MMMSPKAGTASAEEFYRKLCSIHDHPEQVVLGGNEPPMLLSQKLLTLNYGEWMMMQDALTYFPGDILTKVDRAAMAVSLETRTPFTDPELMAFAWQMPLKMKMHKGEGKLLLRELLYRYVPKALIERPKAGFAAPIGAWLRGPLQAWAADLLSPATLKEQGFFDAEAVSTMWEMHQSGQRDMEQPLWNLLMFESWFRNRTNAPHAGSGCGIPSL